MKTASDCRSFNAEYLGHLAADPTALLPKLDPIEMTEEGSYGAKEDMLTRNDPVTQSRAAPKPAWRSPKLEELGNLRDFVQAGNAYGKSGPNTDGSSEPDGEMKS